MVLAGALCGCAPKSPETPQASGAASADVGQRIYNGNCLPCHQEAGTGIPGVYPSLAGSPVVLGDPGELTRWVLKGQRPASMPTGRYAASMLQFGWMKPADAAALFSYVRTSFGNSAAPVDSAAVAKALAQ